MNTLDWIGKWAEYTPDKIAITCYETNFKYTYLELHVFANRLAAKLLDLGLREGDRVAAIAEHNPNYIILFCACQRLGLILVPLNFRMASVEVDKQLKDCKPKLFLYSESLKEKLSELLLKDFQVLEMSKLEKYYAETETIQKEDFEIKEDNPIFLFYTSGTTGNPKGVIYTNKMMFWNSLNTSMQLGITFRDSTINTLPPYHTSGWNVFITPLLHKGGHIGMLGKFDPEKTLCLLELENTTLFMALPTMLLMMQKTEVFKQVQLNKLRYIISGGEKVDASLVSYWWEEKGIYIRPGYGLTEAGPSITSLHHKIAILKPNSIGKPNFYLESKIIDSKGEKVKVGEVGELCLKGEVVTPGYWNNSVLTKSKIVSDWLYTGDLAVVDDEGFIFLKGRKDDMYISGGENIYPQEIELLLEQIPGVDRAGVFSIDDKKWGSCGVAFIESKDTNLNVDSVRNYLKQNMAGYKHPKYIFILDEIPLTSLGKMSRKKLNEYFYSLKH